MLASGGKIGGKM